MLNILPKFELEPIRTYLDTFWTALRPWTTASRTTERSCSKQDQIGGRTRDIGGTVDRDADIRGVQRRGIVDAVTHEADNVAEPLQRQQYPKLLLRIDPTKQIDPGQLSDQRLLREMRQRVTSEHTRDRYADFGKDVAGHKLVVAGQHLH